MYTRTSLCLYFRLTALSATFYIYIMHAADRMHALRHYCTLYCTLYSASTQSPKRNAWFNGH